MEEGVLVRYYCNEHIMEQEIKNYLIFNKIIYGPLLKYWRIFHYIQ